MLSCGEDSQKPIRYIIEIIPGEKKKDSFIKNVILKYFITNIIMNVFIHGPKPVRRKRETTQSFVKTNINERLITKIKASPIRLNNENHGKVTNKSFHFKEVWKLHKQLQFITSST